MAQTCTRCSRSNPGEAVFCYYDGAPLGHGPGAAVDVGKQRFATPLVFPSGTRCGTFDELAICCWNDWDQALDALQRGHLESFFTSIGRHDLAVSARQAAQFPDRARGFDQFIGQLPTRALPPARLEVDSSDIQLNGLHVGEDRTIELKIRNQGMRLLHGTISCTNGVWLGIGKGAGVQNKIFTCTDHLVVQLQIRGKHLRAARDPSEDQVTIESNGGNATVHVRVQVPVTPYPSSVLAGAATPRQIAEKAKAAPRDAAALFESGAVARWYKDNGWEYPVKVQGATGIACVQQFFEALGLTAPPKVSIRPKSLEFQGAVGEQLRQTLEVTTPEKRAVWAHAQSDQPWLQAYKTSEGKGATFRVEIPSVPDSVGETLHGTVTVTSNGNQRFKVPVSLTVGPRSGSEAPRKHRKSVVIAADRAAVYGERSKPTGILAAAPVSAAPFDDLDSARAVPGVAKKNGFAVLRVFHLLPLALILLGLLVPFVHDIPVVYHALKEDTNGSSALAGGWPGDGGSSAGSAPSDIVEDAKDDPNPKIALRFQDEPYSMYFTQGSGGGIKGSGTGQPAPPDKELYTEDPTARFGLVTLLEKDPSSQNDPFNPGHWKRLTYQANGWTNNTCVRLDGKESLFGVHSFYSKKSGELHPTFNWPGAWKSPESRKIDLGRDKDGRKRNGFKSIWTYPDDNVEITQTVEIVRGDTRLLDTCMVTYQIANKDNKPHRVGLRFLLDTFIGATDGVPFTIPTEKSARLCDTSDDFDGKDNVPDYIQVLENEDLAKPGTVAQLQFKLGKEIESPDRVTLGAWPNDQISPPGPVQTCLAQWTLWDVPVQSMKRIQEINPNAPADSCVVMYWNESELEPGKTKMVGFTYGLGSVASSEGGKLALTVGGSFWTGGEFTATAYVSKPQKDQTVTLVLPDGFKIVGGDKTQDVPAVPRDAARNYSTVSWRVQAPDRKGTYNLEVDSSTGATQKRPVTIKGGKIFE